MVAVEAVVDQVVGWMGVESGSTGSRELTASVTRAFLGCRPTLLTSDRVMTNIKGFLFTFLSNIHRTGRNLCVLK